MVIGFSKTEEYQYGGGWILDGLLHGEWGLGIILCPVPGGATYLEFNCVCDGPQPSNKRHYQVDEKQCSWLQSAITAIAVHLNNSI